jgi:hypothetical protein
LSTFSRSLGFLLCLFAGASHAQSIRDRTRPTYDTGTNVTESQAADLTLTLSEAAIRPVQTWIRAGARIDNSRRVLTAEIRSSEIELVKIGQRVRAFPPDAKASMYQAKVTRVVRARSASAAARSLKESPRVTVEATLPGLGRENSTYYVMEIVVERGEFLSVPNEAIIQEGDKNVVYVQQHPGHYVPQEIHVGLQGELYTQILHGLKAGDQVVTIGSFFIDSQHKLKAAGPAMSNDHQHH